MSNSLQSHGLYSLPCFSILRILQARILEWVAIPFSRGSSWPTDWTWISCIAGRFFTIWATREAQDFNSEADKDIDAENKHVGTKSGKGSGIHWETGIDSYALLRIKQMTNDNLLYSTGEKRRYNLVLGCILLTLEIHSNINTSCCCFSHPVMSDSLWPRGQ